MQMTMERTSFEKLLDLLDQVLTKMGSIHSEPYDFGTGVPLYRTEIHTIRAIGENRGINITKLAEHLGVTKGAVSQMINKLVKKKMVKKTHSYDNAKEILLELTDLGWIGFRNHEQFHMEMLDIVREYYGDRLKRNVEMLIMVMTDVNEILDKYEQQRKVI